MLTVFWNMRGPITIDFLKKGVPVNSISYCQLFWQNSPYLLNDPCTQEVDSGKSNLESKDVIFL